jgi:hypothetical protein
MRARLKRGLVGSSGRTLQLGSGTSTGRGRGLGMREEINHYSRCHCLQLQLSDEALERIIAVMTVSDGRFLSLSFH